MATKRRAQLHPRIGEVFSLSQSGQSAGPGDLFGFHDPDPGPPDDGGGVHGIQTQAGEDINTQDGIIIQAEEQ